MQILEEIAGSALFWAILAQAVAAIWAMPRIRRWREEIRQSRYGEVWDATVESVQETYREFVRIRKQKAADGKLTDEERSEARDKALYKLRKKVRRRAPEALAELTNGTLISLIEDAVGREKRKGKA